MTFLAHGGDGNGSKVVSSLLGQTTLHHAKVWGPYNSLVWKDSWTTHVRDQRKREGSASILPYSPCLDFTFSRLDTS